MAPMSSASGGKGFGPDARLHDSADYTFVFRRGRKVVGGHFICYLAYLADSPGRIGIGASRKTGNAVVRNRIKRRIREFYRHVRAALKPHYEVVVVVRPGAGSLSHGAMKEELESLFQRGGLLS